MLSKVLGKIQLVDVPVVYLSPPSPVHHRHLYHNYILAEIGTGALLLENIADLIL